MKPIITNPDIIQALDDMYMERRRMPEVIPVYDIADLLDTVHEVDALDLLAMLPDESIDLIFTDEPYGITSSILAFYSRKPMVTDFDFDDDLPAHLTIPWVQDAYRVLKPDSALVCTGISSWNTSFEDICNHVGFEFKCNDVWCKTNATTRLRPGGFRSAHEMIWIASKGTISKRMGKIRQQELLNWTWEASCPNCQITFPVVYSNNYSLEDVEWSKAVDWTPEFLAGPSKHHGKRSGHRTAKPDWLAARYIDMLSKPGDIILDMFMGEGTFPLMAKRMGRHFIAGDIDAEWFEVVKEKLDSFQGSVIPEQETQPEQQSII